jgi:RimJ/RimL family protein N-acetyltransferase
MSDPSPDQVATGAAMPQAVLDGRRVRLRAVGPQDYDWLFQLNSMPELAHRWRGRPGSLNPSQVAEFLWNNVYCQFVITRRRDGRPLGLVVAYGADLPNRTVRFGIVLDPQFHSVGWPLEAAGIFIDYLFETSDFRKLYSEAVDYNLQAYQSALDGGLVHMEGCLKAHVFSAGAYRDYYMFAIYREEWLAARSVAAPAEPPSSF